ncbi:MAG: TatD family hydrolase [Nanoarchaeota archaeon]|jgi:TatD DNase family protein|nr:TatD family hydrolase [Nanoarchaeota archaeon]
MIDTHAHLDIIDKEYLPTLIQNAKDAGIKTIITQSVNIPSLTKSLEIAKQYPEIVKFSAGLYPEETLKESDFDELKEFVTKNIQDVFAIGEIGMDFSHPIPSRELQGKIFRKQLDLAQELNLPVSIHTRKAEKEIIEILKEYRNVKKILHCFSGKFKLIKEANEIGCYFSIPTNIVRSEHFQKMASELPKEKILTETDTPFLSPHKDKNNEPAFVVESLKMFSLLWKQLYEDVDKQIDNNYEKVYC